MKSTSATTKKAASKSSMKEWSAGNSLFVHKAVPWVPHHYQKKAKQFLKNTMHAALWLDPGLGKTSICLSTFKDLKKAGLARRMLVVAPLRVCFLVWPKEREDWTNFNDLKMTVLHDDDPVDRRSKDDKIEDDSDIFVINPEGLEWLMKEKRFEYLDFDVLCIDESSKFKHTNTQRFKILKPKLGSFARRWTLTGSPSSNGYMDVFGQIYVTDMGRSLGPYITYYRNTYFDSFGYGGYQYRLKEGAEVLIQKRLKPIVLRLDASDYIKMPTELPVPVFVDLPKKARKVYDEMEEQLLSVIKSDKFVALNAAAAGIKCLQIANGGLYKHQEVDEHGLVIAASREWVNLHDEKVKAVESIVEELGGKPALIAYNFEHDLDRLLKTFGKDVPRLGQNIRRDIALERMWNAGELPILLGHPASVGHGLNLQKAGNDVIWHSLTYDYELYDQFNRRVVRQGNKNKFVRIHHIIARDTVDEAIMAAMSDKKRTQAGLLNALRKFYTTKQAA